MFVSFKVDFNDVLKEVGSWSVEFVLSSVTLGLNRSSSVMLGETALQSNSVVVGAFPRLT